MSVPFLDIDSMDRNKAPMFTAVSQFPLSPNKEREDGCWPALIQFPDRGCPYCSLHFLPGPSLLTLAIICNVAAKYFSSGLPLLKGAREAFCFSLALLLELVSSFLFSLSFLNFLSDHVATTFYLGL